MQALPFIAIGMKALGPIVKGVAGYEAGKYNRKVADANASNVMAEGVAQEQRIRDAARIAAGRQIGAQAESGFEVGTGTALDSLLESATEAELDAMDAHRQAQTRSDAYRSQGAQAYAEGKAARLSGFVGAAGAVVSGAIDYATATRGSGGVG